MKRRVSTNKAPNPIGPFSQAVVVDNWVFVSGMGGLDPKTGKVVGSGLKEQTIQAMENVKAILEAAGSCYDDVVKAVVYLTKMADYPVVNGIYASYMGKMLPARCCVAVSELPADEIMKLDVVAYKENKKS
jgi:2-iminobutanoate/2-iminopropanoate deaminase